MKTHRWDDLKRSRLSPEELEQIHREAEQEVLELNLRAVRELVDRTQQDVAGASGMAQSEVSKTERRNDHLISTLRRYVEALGGELEVSAVFGDKRIRLRGV
jgi:hypothetical protein